jgi:hypothetical protein
VVAGEQFGRIHQLDTCFGGPPEDARAREHVFKLRSQGAHGELTKFSDETPVSLKDLSTDGDAGAETGSQSQHRRGRRGPRGPEPLFAEERQVCVIVCHHGHADRRFKGLEKSLVFDLRQVGSI